MNFKILIGSISLACFLMIGTNLSSDMPMCDDKTGKKIEYNHGRDVLMNRPRPSGDSKTVSENDKFLTANDGCKAQTLYESRDNNSDVDTFFYINKSENWNKNSFRSKGKNRIQQWRTSGIEQNNRPEMAGGDIIQPTSINKSSEGEGAKLQKRELQKKEFEFPKTKFSKNRSDNENQRNKGKDDKKKEKAIPNDLWLLLKNCLLKQNTFQVFDSWVLKLHYRLGFVAFAVSLCFVINAWFQSESITCINASTAVHPPQYIVNICLSYSFVQISDGKGHFKKHFQLAYRWIHYSFALLAAVFYLPRIVMKRFGNQRFKALALDLHSVSDWYSTQQYGEILEVILKYYDENLGTHKGMYIHFLLNHVFCVVISFLSSSFLDYLLQDNFWTLPLMFPFVRDPKGFGDGLSKVFPPFVSCHIFPAMRMQSARDEFFNCHLLLMELYEKIFTFLWFLLFVLLVVGSLSVVLLLIFAFRPGKRFLLVTKGKRVHIDETANYLLRHLDFGDIFSLYLVKSLVNEAQFCRVCNGVAEIVESRKRVNAFGMTKVLRRGYEGMIAGGYKPVMPTAPSLEKHCRRRLLNVSNMFEYTEKHL